MTHGLEAEHVAHQRGEDVDHGARLEQVERIGDEGVEALVVARHVLDPVGPALVVVEVGEQVRPHGGPGARGGLGGHGGGGLLARHARLGRHLEARQDVGIGDRVIRLPIRLAVLFDARLIGLHCHEQLLFLVETSVCAHPSRRSGGLRATEGFGSSGTVRQRRQAGMGAYCTSIPR
jgi:hypothetical protein